MCGIAGVVNRDRSHAADRAQVRAGRGVEGWVRSETLLSLEPS